jgi:hypothetical protein
MYFVLGRALRIVNTVAVCLGGSTTGQVELIVKLLKATPEVETFFIDSDYLQR